MNRLFTRIYCALKGYGQRPGAYLHQANLSKANLKGANLEGANLEDAILESANLEDANLEGANLAGANLQGANLDGAILLDADLKGTNLKGANLDAFLTRDRLPIELTLFKNALRRDLKGIELMIVILKGGNKYLSYLESAFQKGVFVKNANLTGATYDKNTRWPTGIGFDPKAAGAIFVA